MKSIKHHSSMVLRGLRGAPERARMVTRAVSLSDSRVKDPCPVPQHINLAAIVFSFSIAAIFNTVVNDDTKFDSNNNAQHRFTAKKKFTHPTVQLDRINLHVFHVRCEIFKHL